MAVLLFLLFIMGLLVGAVINALADDLPLRQNPRLPHYADGTPKPVLAWLGLSAYVFGKRTSPSGARLGWRYPAVELGTSALFVLTAITTADRPEIDTLQLIFYLIYMALFMLHHGH